MRVVYIADDGTKFDDEFECTDYEWKQSHPLLQYIKMYDKNGNRLTDLFSEETYGNVTRIFIESEEEAKALRELSNYTGFCCYESVNSSGLWLFDEKDERFVRVG